MRLVFSPGEEEKFSAAQDELVDSFLAWAGEHGRAVDPFVVSAALDYKYGVDGRLGRWRVGDVQAVLTEWFPRKVTMLEPGRGEVVPSLHAMVDFLIDSQFLAAGSAGTGELHAEIDRYASVFLAAMADERSYDLGKFWAMKMLEHGVDLEDHAAVERFIAAAQAGEFDVDQGVLDEIVQRQFFTAKPEPAQRPDLPPVLLPTTDELLIAAEASVVPARLRTLVRWVGTGRKLTKTGRLTVADARELAGLLDVDQPYLAKARSSADLPGTSLALRWAAAARLVRTVKGKLVPVKNAAPLLDKPLELWRRAFDVFDELGETLCSSRGLYEVRSLLDRAFAETVTVLWLSLYTAGGSPVPVELLHLVIRDAIIEQFGYAGDRLTGSIQQQMWRRDLIDVLAALETLGVVRPGPNIGPAEHAKIAELSGRDDPDTTLVELTPLGLWAINQLLRDQGVNAPTVGELATEGIEVVCIQLSNAAPEVIEAELVAWVAARGTAAAAAELAQFMARTDDPSHRLFALLALAQTGEHGLAAALKIRAGGGLAGAVVTTWLIEQDAIDPASLTEAELLLGLADHLVAMLEQGFLIDELANRPVDDQVDLVQRLAHADHPNRLELLDAIAEQHPDRQVAKAARKVRMKPRPGGLN